MRRAFLAISIAALAAGCAARSSPGALPALGGSLAATADSQSDAAVVRRIVNQAFAALPRPTAPAYAFAVYYHAKPYFFYRGRTLASGGRKVDGSTLFELGSVTKSFTGIMLGAAIAQGAGGVALGDPPMKWVRMANPLGTAPNPIETTCPRVEATPVPRSRWGTVKSMTLLELATFTSGLHRDPPKPYDKIVARQCYAPQQLVNYIDTVTAPQPPAAYDYSNIGYGMLGYVLSGIYAGTGTPPDWYDLTERQILVPMGMTHTFDLQHIPKSMQSHYAQPYVVRGGKLVRTLRWTWDPWPAAGALRSTAPDMMSYLMLSMRLRGPRAMLDGVVAAQSVYANLPPGGQGFAWVSQSLYAPSPSLPPPPQMIDKDGATKGSESWIEVLLPPNVPSPMGIVTLGDSKESGAPAAARAILAALYLHDRAAGLVR